MPSCPRYSVRCAHCARVGTFAHPRDSCCAHESAGLLLNCDGRPVTSNHLGEADVDHAAAVPVPLPSAGYVNRMADREASQRSVIPWESDWFDRHQEHYGPAKGRHRPQSAALLQRFHSPRAANRLTPSVLTKCPQPRKSSLLTLLESDLYGNDTTSVYAAFLPA